MLKSCKYCGRIHDGKYKCEKKPIYKGKRKETEQLRYTTAMKKKSEEIKKAAHYLCEVCLHDNILVWNELETHHIIKLQERQDLALSNLNLVCLCRNCHEKAEKGIINAIFLRELAQKREQIRPPAYKVLF